MYKDNDMYEVNDYDADIKTREALIKEAKSIEPSSDWNAVMRDISDLKRRWKRIAYWDSAYEEKMSEEFDGYLDVFYAKRNKGYQSNEALKQELIARAKTLSTSTNWNQATTEMNELMTQWKATGTSGKDSDDALWETFNEARQVFFDRKHDHWENLQVSFANALEIKKELIIEAASLCDSQEWQKTSEQYRVLMEKWKAAGSAGKEQEDTLWNEFQTYRQKFFDERTKYYDELHVQQEERYVAKQQLVEQAKTIFESKEFTKEQTDQMKNLSADWKKIGSCGKDHEDMIWTEFRSIMDGYFNGLKQWREQRHAQWRHRMSETRSRKLELIQDQKRQIKHMQQDMVGLLGQRAIDDMEDRIADKEDFIKELEAQIADINKSLADES